MTVISITVEHLHGEIVYLKTDKDQLPRVVTGYNINPNGFIYRLSQNDRDTFHHGCEITKEKDQVLTLT